MKEDAGNEKNNRARLRRGRSIVIPLFFFFFFSSISANLPFKRARSHTKYIYVYRALFSLFSFLHLLINISGIFFIQCIFFYSVYIYLECERVRSRIMTRLVGQSKISKEILSINLPYKLRIVLRVLRAAHMQRDLVAFYRLDPCNTISVTPVN